MLVIAHRGASGEYPENSLLACKKALEQGAHGIEIDVQYHQDSGKFIVFHDYSLKRLTGKTGNINNYPLATLLTTSIGHEQYIITLEQVIALIPSSIFLNIELKVDADSQIQLVTIIHKLQQLLIEAVTQQQITWTQLYISSFNHQLIQLGQQQLPHANFAALITQSALDLAVSTEKMSLAGVNPDIKCLNQKLVSDIHQRGLSCWVFTIDSVEDIKKCISYNVDAIFTNFPRRTRELIESMG
ncbi:glycerophosphodiester phosphodiesterase [Thalassotalea piscium]